MKVKVKTINRRYTVFTVFVRKHTHTHTHTHTERERERERDNLKNFAKFTGKHLCQRLSFLLKKTLPQVFSSGFYEIFKSTVLTEHVTFFTEHIRATASVLTLLNFQYI